MLFSDPYFATILGGVTAGLSGSGLQLALFIAQEPGDLDHTLAYLRGGHVDGAMIVSHHRGDRLPEALASAEIPVVFDGRPMIDTSSGRQLPPYIDADNVGGGRLAAEHLLERGKRKLGTVAGPADMAPGIDRLTGWTSVLDAHGIDSSAVTYGDFTATGGAAATAELLGRYPDLDGIFVASDLMATGALQELATRSLRVPDDVAIVGFDDLIFSATTTPPLTTVRQPTRDAGRRLAEALICQLTGTPLPDPVQVLPTELVIRAST
jgi:DNA-binding LacI/PurR family transcriptional regulator